MANRILQIRRNIFRKISLLHHWRKFSPAKISRYTVEISEDYNLRSFTDQLQTLKVLPAIVFLSHVRGIRVIRTYVNPRKLIREIFVECVPGKILVLEILVLENF